MTLMAPADFDPDSPEHLRRLRLLAEQAARAGGAAARKWFHADYRVRRKADGTEVTDADEAAQTAVLADLRAARPNDAIIAEETIDLPPTPAGTGTSPVPADTGASLVTAAPPPSAEPSPTDRLCWIIDPLDGTRNYICGVPIYACSVGAMYRGCPIAGAVYDPERDTLYSADRATGFLIDGRPWHTSGGTRRPRPGTRRPLVGIPSHLEGAAAAVLRQWGGRVVVRNLGATALHLALVAAGVFQAVLICDSRLWDIAAGWLMVTLTGGTMTRLDGGPLFPLDVSGYDGAPLPSLACADRALHARLLPPGG